MIDASRATADAAMTSAPVSRPALSAVSSLQDGRPDASASTWQSYAATGYLWLGHVVARPLMKAVPLEPQNS